MPLKPVTLAPEAVDTRTLTFDDNRLCVSLFGRHHEHLAQIEQQLPVSLIARGNEVTIGGEPAPVEAAAAVLEDLYRRLEHGLEVGPHEVDGAIRLVVGGGAAPAPGSFRGHELTLHIDKRRVGPRSTNQAAYLRAMQRHDLVFGIGPAGTGKTYLAVATGVSMLRERKVDPYLRPLYDALQDMLPEGRLATRIESGQIEVAPLAFMRGRTLSNAFVILDEAQNTTPAQMKMFLTRLGENSRMVVTGDPSQDDLPPGTLSGLVDAVGRLGQIEDVGIIRFTDQDIVRHPLVERILRAYRADDASAPGAVI